MFQYLKLNLAVFCILRGGVNTLYRIFDFCARVEGVPVIEIKGCILYT